ncbi:MAG: hypothetical protein A2V86_09070 [Deltaproteobacteria bacterium RBG_16_49_23]|nr:MAG: hypothetical protein A2V86_09070 [Deltaproteobacteria bacterium RBG_16_49_23]
MVSDPASGSGSAPEGRASGSERAVSLRAGGLYEPEADPEGKGRRRCLREAPPPEALRRAGASAKAGEGF